MLKILRHKDNESLYLAIYKGIVKKAHAEADWNFFEIFSKNKNNITKITYFTEDAILVDHDFLNVAADYANKNSNKLAFSFIVGIKGFKKYLYSIYVSLYKVSFERKVCENLQEVEKILRTNFDTEFIIIYEFTE